MTDHTPAHVDVDLERTVLGQILEFAGVDGLYASAGLTETDFWRPVHRQIFAAIATVTEAGLRPDLRTVGAELRTTGHWQEVGGAYLSSLVDGIPRPAEANVAALTARLQELAAHRQLERAGRDLAQHPGGAPSAVVEQHLRSLDAVLRRTRDQRLPLDAVGQMATYRADLEREAKGRIWLGFPTLDNLLQGLRPGEVCGLLARPGIGKTLWLCNVTRRLAEADFGQVFFSLEMPAAQIIERLWRICVQSDRHGLRNRIETDERAAQTYGEQYARLLLLDTPGLTVAGMGTILRHLALDSTRPAVRVVTVDHLGLIGGDRGMSTYDRVSTQARELKELAKRYEVAVLLAVQVNRDAGGDGSRELGLGSARDSGVVEEAMDYLIALRRLDRSQTLTPVERDRYRDVLFAKVVKNRHGDLGREVALRLNASTLLLEEDIHIEADDSDLARLVQARSARR